MGSERIERCGNGLEPDAICQLRFRFPSGEHSERFLAAMDALRADVWIYRYEGRVTVGNPRYTKGAGAAYFARLWGIADKDVHTVGDARNDLSMLEAYHGFSILGGELGEEYPYRTPDVASVCLKYL